MSGHTDENLAGRLQGSIDFSDKFNGIAKIDVSLLNECVAALRSHADLVRALEELQAAETSYRMCHDLDGDGHINTGRAWDKLRQAGQRARAALAKLHPAKGEG